MASAGAGPAHWTTNYYDVTGSSIREIRRSMKRERPRKVTRDALTEWTIRTRFAPARIQGAYRCSGFTTITIVRLTIPRWTPDDDTPESVIDAWTHYQNQLLEHEIGHGRIAEAAARELHRRVATAGTAPESDQLTATIQDLITETLEEFKEREREYDRLTKHGVEQGAVLFHRQGHPGSHSSQHAPVRHARPSLGRPLAD